MFESTQAKFLGYTAIVLLLLTIGQMIKMAVVRTPLGTWMTTIVATLFSAFVIFLYIFDVNCVIMGGCNVWGWFKFALVMLMLVIQIIVVIVALFATAKKKEEKPEDATASAGALKPLEPVATAPATPPTMTDPVAKPAAPTTTTTAVTATTTTTAPTKSP